MEGVVYFMPLLMLFGLVILALLIRREKQGRPLPAPIMATLILSALSFVTMQPWLLNIAAIIAVAWILGVITQDNARRTRTAAQGAGTSSDLTPQEYERAALRELPRESTGQRAEFDRLLTDVQQSGRAAPELIPVPTRSRDRREKRRERSGQRAAPADTRDELTRSIDELLNRAGHRLPTEAVMRIRELQARTRDTMTYLRERGAEASEQGFLVRQTALDYLPGAVDAFLCLPPSLAATTPIVEGKTGRDLLLEQIDLLLHNVEGILSNAARAEGNQLLAHKRFLEDRLAPGRRDFDI